ncbi:inorganic phosphate transporter [Streptomyces sp. NBC_00154]|uniref:inorganic phosphate transporter n=1 Tax=Streptomyces sp. NBC_00154 TaxID=2975670 RepID=UPI00224DF74E|nr:inorganic phosphate transporter [Streptomyces sp. NBC_00154]MCX5316133.1 inorganic phosphate transporter [Streptomyces sp. NBC_00154]
MEVLVFILVLALAAANGANDVPKGVATLAGAGVANIRTAVWWGTLTTAIGCLVSLSFAAKLTSLFSKEIVSAAPTAEFAVAVLIGTCAWVALATVLKLPVSTTHALVGSLLGAGVIFARSQVHWDVLVNKVVLPLLLSVFVAYLVSAVLTWIGKGIAASAERRRQEKLRATAGVGPGTAAVAEMQASERNVKTVSALHWATSGFTSFARGLNDAPKIVAIGSFALLGGWTPQRLLFAVTAVMAIGGLLAGARVAKSLTSCVDELTHVDGFTANLTTALLVGLGAFRGMPMSTTHVSVGAISGTVGKDLGRIKRKTLRDFAIAWLATPPFGFAVAALSYWLLA